jgi:hypothetical protein
LVVVVDNTQSLVEAYTYTPNSPSGQPPVFILTMTTTVHESQIETPGKDDLNFKLDEALERYLNTLDVYQQAQQKLTSHLSAVSGLQPEIFTPAKITSAKGYFSLAQANFSNAARARYGPDYYDERMQALRVVYVLFFPSINGLRCL